MSVYCLSTVKKTSSVFLTFFIPSEISNKFSFVMFRLATSTPSKIAQLIVSIRSVLKLGLAIKLDFSFTSSFRFKPAFSQKSSIKFNLECFVGSVPALIFTLKGAVIFLTFS